MKIIVINFLNHLADEIIFPYDNDQTRYQKIIITLLTLFSIITELGCGLANAWYQNYSLGLIYILHAATITINVILFLLTKRYTIFLVTTFLTTSIFPCIIFLISNTFISLVTIIVWGVSLLLVSLRFRPKKELFITTAAYFMTCGSTIILSNHFIKPEFHTNFMLLTIFILFQLSFIGAVLSLVILYSIKVITLQKKDLHHQKEIITKEEIKAKKIIKDFLPDTTIDRFTSNETMITDNFDDITVLFADIVGFTRLTERISSKDLVDMLNVIFSAFDQCAESYGLEKIKTIGDAYMAAAGVPVPREDHAFAAAEMAFKMLEEIKRYSEMIGENLNIRIGLSSGPVIAGAIGIKKAVYDIWGDTVNIAARMESHGVPGSIHISEATYKHLTGHYIIRERGEIQIKGKGVMRTYFLADHLESLNDLSDQLQIKNTTKLMCNV